MKDRSQAGRRSVTAAQRWLKDHGSLPDHGRTAIYEALAAAEKVPVHEISSAFAAIAERSAATGQHRKQIDEWFNRLMDGDLTATTLVRSPHYLRSLRAPRALGRARNSGRDDKDSYSAGGLLSVGLSLASKAASRARPDSPKTRELLDILRALLDSYKMQLSELSRHDEGTFIDEISRELIAVFDDISESAVRYAVNGGVKKK